MKNRSLIVSYSIAMFGMVARRLRMFLNRRELAQGRDALDRFEGEGGAIVSRPALTPEVVESRSDK